MIDAVNGQSNILAAHKLLEAEKSVFYFYFILLFVSFRSQDSLSGSDSVLVRGLHVRVCS